MKILSAILTGLLLSGSLWAAQPSGTADRAPFGGIRSATMSGDETLDPGSSPKFQKLDPNGASRIVTLPAEANSQGLWYIITNTAGTTYTITVKNTAASTISTVAPGQSATIACNGTTWMENRKVLTVDSPGEIQVTEVALTNAQVLALRATPITLVAAPGAGKMLELVGGVLIFDYTAAYTETADNLAVKYNDGSGVQASTTIEATGFVDATADTATTMIGKTDTIVAKTGCENKALVLHNTGDGEYGGGNAANVIRVKVTYRVWSTGW